MTNHPNHPNRSRRRRGLASPTPDQIRSARLAGGWTQTQFAELLHSALRSVQEWESGDGSMHPGLWELFGFKTSPARTFVFEVPTAGIGSPERGAQPPRVMWVVEVFEETQWRATEWVGATRDRARDQASEWRADTGAPVRVVKYLPAA